ncbi:MAG: ArnT family glycosyltransferase [Paludibacteraceae bacterium]
MSIKSFNSTHLFDFQHKGGVWEMPVLLFLLGLLLFLPGLGSVHLFDWDEINFAESAREMILTGNYLDVQINFETFWEKPPLFIWMQALSMKIFGINEFAARFPNAIAGALVLPILFFIGRRLKDNLFGLLWTGMYVCSLFPFFFFKSGIIDPWFNLFIFSGIYFFIRYTSASNNESPALMAFSSALMLGLAVLTKGPVGFLIFLLAFVAYLIFNKFKLNFKWLHVLVFVATFAFVGGFWFILQIANGHWTVIQDFIVYQIRLFQTQDAGHGGFFGYHFVMILIGVFPASVIALPVFRRSILKDENDENVKHFFRWMMILFWVVLLLFTIVKTKIVHYASMTYYPLTFMGAWYAYKLIAEKKKLPSFARVLVLILAIIYGIVLVAIPYIDRFKHLIVPYVQDEFAVGNLQATSTWYGFEPVIGIILIATAIVFFVRTKKELSFRPILILLFGSLIYISATMFFVVPQVEKYSQAAAIEFYKSKIGEDCYIKPTFKSYAHYFYSERKPANNLDDLDSLVSKKLDKPCYFVVKNTKKSVARFTDKAPDAQLLYDKNGFIFYVRK